MMMATPGGTDSSQLAGTLLLPTRVPLALPKSLTSTMPSRTVRIAWLRETDGPPRTISLSSARPTVRLPDSGIGIIFDPDGSKTVSHKHVPAPPPPALRSSMSVLGRIFGPLLGSAGDDKTGMRDYLIP